MSHRASPALLHARFLDRQRRSPDRVALIDEDRAVTFGELGDRVARTAGGLAAEGIGAGAMVGLHMERSADWVASTLAILSVDAAVVPLPPSYPPGRLAEILEHAKLDAVIDMDDSPLDPGLPGRRLALRELVAADPNLDPPGAGDPDQPAFVLCSSGSTGRPKMIVRSHRSFFHRLRWTWEHHPFGSGERCCQKSHMTTTHALYELFEPLLEGVPVVIIRDQEVRNLERFWDMIRSRHVSRLLLVPSQLQASLGMPGFEAPPLEVLVLMGEYVSPELAERAVATFPESTSIYSIYGSTEASSTLVCDLRASFRPGRELPLGRPIQPDIMVRVLDDDGRPVPAGGSGRLHVGGSPLFTEYFRDPELTRAVLLDGPDTSSPWYDTHDDVRWTEEGHLEFIGRADGTLKIRGFRVDAREVEGTLLRHPDVRLAAVVAVEDPGGGRTLHAFVAPAAVDREGLYRSLRERLPDYMVPSSLSTLAELPLTPSGKVDRLRLRTSPPRGTRPSGSPGAFVGTARAVAEVWERLLGEEALSPDAGFFEVGGTSLSAFSLVHELRERFDLSREQLDAETVYRFPTIAELAGHIDRVRTPGASAAETVPTALVTLRRARDPALSPVFFVAPAGGTLGCYGKLARSLTTPRELIGIRDPFTWGDRDPASGFDAWVDRYLEEARERQPEGPYHIVAYSSGVPFGYEMARRLRRSGESVPLLALIDPVGVDAGNRSRFGWWVMKAVLGGPALRILTRLGGHLRWRPLNRIAGRGLRLLVRNRSGTAGNDASQLMEQAVRNRFHVLSLSALLELNTGLPYALAPEDLDAVPPEEYLAVLRARVDAVSPEVDFEVIERVIRQYPLQAEAQESYEFRSYDGEVRLVEASTAYTGLVRALLRPYVKNLGTRVLEVGAPSDRIRRISERWGPTALHFRSIRDDRFVEELARDLDEQLA